MNRCFEANRRWAARMKAQEPDFFDKLVPVQTPGYLWIGCSDSRVPANEIPGLIYRLSEELLQDLNFKFQP